MKKEFQPEQNNMNVNTAINTTIKNKDIARMAGVSPATVSRVINRNGRFSKETEERVRAVISREHYIPDLSAAGLRRKRTMVIGIVVPDITNPYFAELVLNIEMRLYNAGYSCMICNTTESGRLEQSHIRSLLNQKVGGIILFSGIRNYSELAGCPVIYVDRPALKDFREDDIIIESDNVQGGYLAAKELLEKGCRHISVLRCFANDRNQMARYEGYLKALKEYNLEEDPTMNLNLDEVSMERARVAILKALDAGMKFDAVLCTTDTLAAGTVLALASRGIQIPKDCMITGYDDSHLTAVIGPGITSVHQDAEQMAALSSELLLKIMNGEKLEKYHFKLPVHLVRRASTSLIQE